MVHRNRSTRLAALAIGLAVQLFLPGTTLADHEDLGPFSWCDDKVPPFWERTTLLLGDVVGFDKDSLTLRVLDRVGDLASDSGEVTIGYPQPAGMDSDFPPFGNRLPLREGLRIVVPIVKENGRLYVLTWIGSKLCEELRLPLATDRDNLDAVRRMKDLAPRGVDEGRTGEFFEGLSGDDAWVRLFCLDALWSLYLSQGRSGARALLEARGQSLDDLLTTLLAMTVEERYTPVERLHAAGILLRGYHGFHPEVILGGLSALVRDDSADIGFRKRALGLAGDCLPGPSVALHLVIARDRTCPLDLRESALHVAGLHHVSPPDLHGRSEAWGQHARTILEALIELLDDSEARIRWSSAHSLAEIAASGRAPSGVMESLDRNELEDKLAREEDEDAKRELQRLIEALGNR